MKVALIANGAVEDLDALRRRLQPYKRIIAVDGGLTTCKALGITPSLIVGDFDSVPPELLDEFQGVPRITLSRDKDQTDLEVALEHEFAHGTEHATLFGGGGCRLDHCATNLLLLSRYAGRLEMRTERETVFTIRGEITLDVEVGQTLSLIPLAGPARGVTSHGLKWELGGRTLDLEFVGISNVCMQKRIRIAVQDGVITCFLLNNLR